MFGLRFFSRASDGAIVLVTRHPVGCPTWHWSVSIHKRGSALWSYPLIGRAPNRSGQWHDYYRLPFGRTLIVSHQDFHRSNNTGGQDGLATD